MPRGWVVVSLVTTSVALSACALLPGSTVAASSKTITVRVDARDFAFTLSRRSVPAGSTVRFVVLNRGNTNHDFVVRGRRTRILRPAERQTITVSFPRKGSFRFLCSVPGHARLGMKGTFGIATRAAPPAPSPPPVDTSKVAMLSRIGAFERPVLVTAPPGDTHRLFVVEQTGGVRIVRDEVTLPRPFLDLRGEVKLSSEPGLLSIAFAPDYARSGRVYAFYNSTAGNGDIRISEFRRHPTDPDLVDPYSERVLLTIPKPWENHNGGMLQFGPDGYLYASVGDGDSGILNPPGFFAQRRDDLLGNILRIDPSSGDPYAVPADNPFVGLDGVRPEIWAYGLRNPWRFWIDGETGSMFVADAGKYNIPANCAVCASGTPDSSRTRARRFRHLDEIALVHSPGTGRGAVARHGHRHRRADEWPTTKVVRPAAAPRPVQIRKPKPPRKRRAAKDSRERLDVSGSPSLHGGTGDPPGRGHRSPGAPAGGR